MICLPRPPSTCPDETTHEGEDQSGRGAWPCARGPSRYTGLSPGEERALQQDHVRGVGAGGQHPLQVFFFFYHVDDPRVPANGSWQGRQVRLKLQTLPH